MIRIQVDIDVKNPEEVLKAHKGEIMGMLVDVVLSKGAKKRRVEKAVCKQITDVVSVELPKRLAEEYIDADVEIRVIEMD